MSDLLDDFREEDDDDLEETPTLVYGSVHEFVREYLRHMYIRPVGPGNAHYRWVAEWWKSPEAVARIQRRDSRTSSLGQRNIERFHRTLADG